MISTGTYIPTFGLKYMVQRGGIWMVKPSNLEHRSFLKGSDKILLHYHWIPYFTHCSTHMHFCSDDVLFYIQLLSSRTYHGFRSQDSGGLGRRKWGINWKRELGAIWTAGNVLFPELYGNYIAVLLCDNSIIIWYFPLCNLYFSKKGSLRNMNMLMSTTTKNVSSYIHCSHFLWSLRHKSFPLLW